MEHLLIGDNQIFVSRANYAGRLVRALVPAGRKSPLSKINAWTQIAPIRIEKNRGVLFLRNRRNV